MESVTIETDTFDSTGRKERDRTTKKKTVTNGEITSALTTSTRH